MKDTVYGRDGIIVTKDGWEGFATATDPGIMDVRVG